MQGRYQAGGYFKLTLRQSFWEGCPGTGTESAHIPRGRPERWGGGSLPSQKPFLTQGNRTNHDKFSPASLFLFWSQNIL